MNERFKVLIAVCILFLVGQFLYLNTLQHDFVWDDHLLIDGNSQMNSYASIKDFFTQDMWLNSAKPYNSGFYRPVTLTSFLVDAKQWGFDSFGFHLTNSLLHAFNGVLLFLILYSLTQRMKVSFFAGLIFIIHPIQTEAVAFISDRGDLLCVFFLLINVLFYIAWRQSRNLFYVFVSMLSLVLAFLSKENAMVGFVIIALIEWFFFAKRDLRTFIKSGGVLCLYALLTGAYIYWRVQVLGMVNAVTTLGEVRYVSILPGFDGFTHMILVIKIIVHYVLAVILPYNQSISYVILPDVSLTSPEMVLKSGFLLMQIFLFLVFIKEKRFMLLFGMLWFYITLLPLVNIVPISNTVADRFLYLPMVGASLFMAEAVDMFYCQMRSVKTQSFYIALMTVLATLMCFKTVLRNQDWHNNYTLFTSALYEKPCAPMAHVNLMTYYNIHNNPQQSRYHAKSYQNCVDRIQKKYRAIKREYESMS